MLNVVKSKKRRRNINECFKNKRNTARYSTAKLTKHEEKKSQMEKFQFVKSRRSSRHVARLTAPKRFVLAGTVVRGTGIPEGDERCRGNVNTTVNRRRCGVRAVVALPSCKAQILAGQHAALFKQTHFHFNVHAYVCISLNGLFSVH